jgi:signal transduction histidine kinase
VDLGDVVSLAGLALRAGRRVEELPAAAGVEEPTLLQERARLASVIHEGITQVITNVAIQLEVLDQVMDDPERARAMTRSARTAVLEALDSLRTAIFEMAPPTAEWGELARGLERYVADVEAQWGLDIRYSVEGEPREVPAEPLGLAFAFAQEALTNLRKHAGTTVGEMGLIFEPRWVILTLCDRGVGFAPGTEDESGLREHQGLALMTTRTRLLGGRFEVRSSPGQGTCVSLRLPF